MVFLVLFLSLTLCISYSFCFIKIIAVLLVHIFSNVLYHQELWLLTLKNTLSCLMLLGLDSTLSDISTAIVVYTLIFTLCDRCFRRLLLTGCRSYLVSQAEHVLIDELSPFTFTNMIDIFGFNCDKIFSNYVYFLYLLYFVYSSFICK